MTSTQLLARATLALAATAGGCAARTSASTPAAPAAAAAAAPDAATARADRWQILLNSGSYLYEVRLLGAHGDTLVAAQPGDTLALPLDDIDELRLVQASAKVAGNARNSSNPLTGVDDAVLKLSRYAPDERRALLAQLLRERAAADGGR